MRKRDSWLDEAVITALVTVLGAWIGDRFQDDRMTGAVLGAVIGFGLAAAIRYRYIKPRQEAEEYTDQLAAEVDKAKERIRQLEGQLGRVASDEVWQDEYAEWRKAYTAKFTQGLRNAWWKFVHRPGAGITPSTTWEEATTDAEWPSPLPGAVRAGEWVREYGKGLSHPGGQRVLRFVQGVFYPSGSVLHLMSPKEREEFSELLSGLSDVFDKWGRRLQESPGFNTWLNKQGVLGAECYLVKIVVYLLLARAESLPLAGQRPLGPEGWIALARECEKLCT